MRTTVNIPDALVAEADALVGLDGITTRNQLIIEALENWVEQKKAAQIDEAFAAMADDSDYLAETLTIEQEFVGSDREVTLLNDD